MSQQNLKGQRKQKTLRLNSERRHIYISHTVRPKKVTDLCCEEVIELVVISDLYFQAQKSSYGPVLLK